MTHSTLSLWIPIEIPIANQTITPEQGSYVTGGRALEQESLGLGLGGYSVIPPTEHSEPQVTTQAPPIWPGCRRIQQIQENYFVHESITKCKE